jgi:hypothetical protein
LLAYKIALLIVLKVANPGGIVAIIIVASGIVGCSIGLD